MSDETPKIMPFPQALPAKAVLAEKKIPLDDESVKIFAKQMGITEDAVRAKNLLVTEDFIEKLKMGKIQFAARPPDPAQLKEGTVPVLPPGVAPQPPNAFQPATPRQTLEQRYFGVMRRTEATRNTSNLPQSTVGLPVAPGTVPAAGQGTNKPIISAFMEQNTRLNKSVLSIRPAGAPNILQEVRTPVKLFVSQHQSPGDLLMLSRAVEDLHKSYPGQFITCMRTYAHELWDNNPNHTHIDDKDPDAMWIAMEYKLVNTSNKGAHHFSHGFRKDFEAKLGLPIDQTAPQGVIHLSAAEKGWRSQIHELLNKDVPFWIIDAGRKSDFTAKHWEVARFQQVVDATPEITWVQVGATSAGHYHPKLTGSNVIDLLGKTSVRQFVRLMYHAAGVVTPVSFPMHLAAAVEMHPRYKRATRPCVVIAGGREPAMWEAYSTHQFLHTCGMLPCCTHGGCWRARVEPLLDGDEKDFDAPGRAALCERPIVSKSGQVIPKCMDMISAEEVITKVRLYNDAYDFTAEEPAKWTVPDWDKPAVVLEKMEQVRINREAKAKPKEAAPIVKDGIVDGSTVEDTGETAKEIPQINPTPDAVAEELENR